MRLLIASGSYLLSYSVWGTSNLGLSISLLLAALYEPVPANVDNWLSTYVLIKVNQLNELVARVKIALGGDELAIKRAGVDGIKPRTVRGCKREIRDMGNYQLYIYTPDVIKSDGAVVYYHGGGFTIMHVEQYNRFISSMAVQLGCVVFSPEYRLAPETPFPGGDTDVCDATKFVFDNCAEFKVNRSKIALTGDSAGGFFILVTWYRLRHYFDENQIQPAALSFIYPAFGYRFDSPSYQANKNAPILPLKDVLFFYLCHPAQPRTDVNYNLLEHQLHFDYAQLSPEFKKRTDPWEWLSPEQLGDAKRPDESTFRTEFTKEEQKLRDCVMKNIESGEYTPLAISDEDLAKLPPCHFYACEYDVLKNDAEIMHARLSALGKPSELVVWKGAFHAQIMFAKSFMGLTQFKRTNGYIDAYVETLRQYI